MALRVLIPVLTILVAACNGEIYLREGVTDGDTFYLSQQALIDDDPVLQSWVSYSLTRSACQLALGGKNPARASSFDCEFSAREHLAETWYEQTTAQPALVNPYLDDLLTIRDADFLGEHVARHFRRRGWDVPRDLDSRAYRRWLDANIPGHEPETHWMGSWNYAKNVAPD